MLIFVERNCAVPDMFFFLWTVVLIEVILYIGERHFKAAVNPKTYRYSISVRRKITYYTVLYRHAVTEVCLPRPSAITRLVILTAVLQLGGYVRCKHSKRALLRYPLRLGLLLCNKTLEEWKIIRKYRSAFALGY